MTEPGFADPELEDRVRRALGRALALEPPLGAGGFAVVFAARDLALNRAVAVKVLRPELAGSAALRERFRREAEAMARLRHPHIIPIYAVGEAEGLAWYVMPRVTGESLRARLDRERRLPLGEARRILSEAAAALAAAHKAGLLHRDIKPDNILLDGDERRVLLTDFGIAKAISGDTPGGALTATGMVVGTPQYMSPEQASGERDIDRRSDLYSLGVVGYQMITGGLPFEAPTVAGLLVKRLTEEAPSVTRRRPDCPPDLAGVVTRCLAREPDRRFPDADTLMQALAAATLGLAPTLAEGHSPRVAVDVPAAIARARRTAGLAAAIALAGLAADLALGRVLCGPPAVLVALLVGAASYGRVWSEGYTWRDVLRRRPPGSLVQLPLDSAEFGPHAEVVSGARNDRAALVATVGRYTRGERGALGDVVPAVDALLARVIDTARQLHAVERQLDPGPEELERRLAATRAELPSPGRDQRAAVLEKRVEAVRALAGRRDALATALAQSAEAVTRVRFAVERGATSGVTDALPLIREALGGDTTR